MTRERYGVLAAIIAAAAFSSAATLAFGPATRPEPRLLTPAELASIAEQCDESLLTWREVEAGLGCAEERIYEIPRTCRCAAADAYALDSDLRGLPRCPEMAQWEEGSDG